MISIEISIYILLTLKQISKYLNKTNQSLNKTSFHVTLKCL